MNENKLIILRNAIREGINSGVDYNFDSELLLKELKSKKKSNIETK